MRGQAQNPTQGFAPQIRVFVVQGPEDNAFIPAALEATAQAFLGRQESSVAPTGTVGGGSSRPVGSRPSGLIGPDTLSPDSDTEYQLLRSRSRSVELRAEQTLRQNLSATARLTLGAGETVYTLPQGLGILRDPTTVRFMTRFATIETGLAWRRPWLPYTSTNVEMAAGLQHRQTKTHVSSALLDVRNKSRQRNAYIALRGGFDITRKAGRGGGHIGAEARLFPGKGVTIGQTFALSY